MLANFIILIVSAVIMLETFRMRLEMGKPTMDQTVQVCPS